MKGLIGSKTLSITLSSLVLFSSCHFASESITPQLRYSVSDRHIQSLPSPFPPLSDEEKQPLWGIEYQIGKGFAKKLDLYRAITAFQRSSILAPKDHHRQLETDYQILLSYYFGKRYRELDQFVSTSPLGHVNESFSAFDDLLVILFDTKWNLGEKEMACQLLELIGKRTPKTYQTLLIGSFMREGNLEKLSSLSIEGLENYTQLSKSPKKAAVLSAILPGLGYLYVGQIQTAFTGFMLNALFIAAIITFFKRRLLALGLLFLSFEIGWYAGGIYGASGQTTYYNQRAFEEVATPIMNKSGYFPIHQLRHAY
jgi:hypothetical protein